MAPRGQNHNHEREGDRSLVENERAIEGLPIRLVIALFVGVAALFLMLQVLDLFDTDDIESNEITVEVLEGSSLDLDDIDGDTNVLEVRVIDGSGQELEEGEDYESLLFQPDTALGETLIVDEENDEVTLEGDGTYNIDGDLFDSDDELNARLGSGQNTGTYEIVPQGGDDFDEAVPQEITLVD